MYIDTMTGTGHAVIGTVIAAKIGNPYLALPIALASHYAADAFPHWDTGTNKSKKTKAAMWLQSLLDVGISLVLPFFLIQYLHPTTNLFYVYLMVIVAQLPDWGAAPYYFLNMKFPPFSWMYRSQLYFDNRLDQPWGVILQVVILTVLVIVAKLY